MRHEGHLPLQQQQPHLPHEVLTMVLQRIEQHERLRSCSLVCQAWRAAAAAATTDITTKVKSDSHNSLTLWLRAHGRHLAHLSLSATWEICQQLLHLPYSQLTQLRSCDMTYLLVLADDGTAAADSDKPSSLVHHDSYRGSCRRGYRSRGGLGYTGGLGARGRGSSSSISSSSRSTISNPLTALCSLTSLSLTLVTLCSIPDSLRSLSALTALRDLCLDDELRVTDASMHQVPPGLAASFLGSGQQATAKQLYLEPLTQLTRIAVDCRYFPEDTVAPLSALQQLQRLELDGDLGSQTGHLAGLPASLTYLRFEWRSERDLSVHSVPAIASLTALRELTVEGALHDPDAGRFSPLLLLSMQQLQVLDLNQLSRGALPELLQVMPRLSSLQRLALGCGEVLPLLPSEAARYSDLLPASPLLWRVALRGTNTMLPDARFGRHVFAGRQLPALHVFIIGDDEEAGDDRADDPFDLPAPCLDDLAIARMAACCPALERLIVPGCLAEGVRLSPLLQLPALTELSLAGEEIDDNLLERQLPPLTGLRSLQIFLSDAVTDAGVGHLTALTRLSRLALYECGISAEMRDPDDDGIIGDMYISDRPSGETVAQLLRKRCRRAAVLLALEQEEDDAHLQGGDADSYDDEEEDEGEEEDDESEEDAESDDGEGEPLLDGRCSSCRQRQEQLDAAQSECLTAHLAHSTAAAEAVKLRQELFESKVAVAGLEEQLAAAQAELQQLRRQA